MRNRTYLFVLVLTLGSLASCSEGGKDANEACESNGDCSSGICHRGVCTAKLPWTNGIACKGPGECRSSFCDEGVCAAGDAAEGTLCIYDEECKSMACGGGRCGVVPDAGPDAGDGGISDGDAGSGGDGLLDAEVPDGACDRPQDCDDKLECTDELCGDAGVCEYFVVQNACAIEDACYEGGTKPEGNPCVKCDPDNDQRAWTHDDGIACDDEELCSHDDSCAGGVCQGKAYTCDDGLTCTDNSCNGDGPPQPTGCEFPIKSSQCLIDSIFCYVDGETDPGNQCRHCDSAKSQTNWTVAPLSGCVTTVDSSFTEPWGVAPGAAGGVYVADYADHQIKLYANEAVVVLAGSGAPGDVDGALATAQFNGPADVAVDATGKVYVADSKNHKIRVITGGNVGTLSGTGNPGTSNGVVNVATFHTPVAVALDDAGKLLYLIDAGTHRIRKIDLTTAVVSTVAGTTAGFADGAANEAKFDQPADLVVDSFGDLFVADSGNHRIRKVDGKTGTVSTVAGNGTPGYVNGFGAAVELDTPVSVAVDSSGNLFVSDALNYRIRRIDGTTKAVLSVAGDGKVGTADGLAGAARFNRPRRLQVDGTQLYLVSPLNGTLRIFIP